MKGKLILVLSVLLLFTACNTEYTCKCTSTDSAGNYIGTSSIDYQASKIEAQSMCSANESSTGNVITTCKIE